MAKVTIVQAGERRPAAAAPSIAGLSCDGTIESTPILGPDKSLQLWFDRLAPGAGLRWDNPPVAHVLFVQEGQVAVGNETIAAGGSIIVEHRSTGELTAGAEGAMLAHFFSSQPPDGDQRAGGHVHAYGPDGNYSRATREGRSSVTSFADANCPTCAIWLHRSNLPADIEVLQHFHTDDEIILILRGQMKVGNRLLGPGTALGIEAETVYGFSAGEDGLQFINFRPTDPFIIFTNKSVPISEPISEREIMTQTIDPAKLERVNEILRGS